MPAHDPLHGAAARAGRRNSTPLPHVVARFRLASRAAAGAVTSLGVLVLAGWAWDRPLLRTGLPGLVSMKPNTAVAFVLLGTGLWLPARLGGRWWRPAAGLVVALLGALTLFEYLTGRALGIDEALFRDPEPVVGHPGRMAFLTAVACILIGLSLTLDASRRLRPLGRGSALACGLLGFAILSGYMFSVRSLYTLGGNSGVALHTALGLTLASLAYLASRPSEGTMRIVTGGTSAGTIGRRLLPVLVVIPVCSGWLVLAGQRQGMYGSDFGLALLVTANSAAMIAATWWVAQSLHTSELARAGTSAALDARGLELAESERRFRELADAMPQIVWTADPDGSLDYYNSRWVDYTGLTIEATRGWGWGPVLHPDDLQMCLDRWREACETGEPYEIEYRFKRASDRTYRWHLGRALPLRGADGRIVKWFGTCTDIDDKKRTEQMLREAQATLEARVAARTADLARSEAATRAALAEKEVMLREIHHRVKNNLAVVSSLFYLESTYARNSDVTAIFDESRRRVRSMALVHETLYGSGNLAQVDFAEYAGALAQEIVAAYRPPDGRVRLDVRASPLPIGLDLAIPCGLILNELISNALKHGFPEGRRGTVTIAIEAGPDGRGLVRVTDDGVGLPDRAASPPGSLGLRLIELLSRQIGGRFEFLPRPAGTDASLTFPLEAHVAAH